ncbi:UNVERIFIED_ORG: MSHA pilin protein MshC [Zoogloea ramigera]|uniref:Prepilin-type N-terminal cleavage/methylation domain-containing protein n=1 Tax=Duganella zoogloeoides TaxID=75659 RepID=A0ABZ0Y5Y3_9BURK|nr:prepilin-type N-terminal cleavage/methylation domain-containing protein [Duganella zoogloeoides]WQH06710.1 prepilin-type N-terminal cleavage/methylation domain-containing protein [Duganella zoogloeoides]
MFMPPAGTRPDRAGFTMVELIMVMVLIGILGAVAGSRFFDREVFEARAYADQAKALIRYAQKLAIAQNRPVFVRSTPAGFAVCFDLAVNATSGARTVCNTAADLAQAPGGANNGTTATRAFCIAPDNLYIANWACLGRPPSVAVASTAARNEMADSGFFFFDSAGRPFNRNDTVGGASSFARLTLNVDSGNQRATLNIEAETGYVF